MLFNNNRTSVQDLSSPGVWSKIVAWDPLKRTGSYGGDVGKSKGKKPLGGGAGEPVGCDHSPRSLSPRGLVGEGQPWQRCREKPQAMGSRGTYSTGEEPEAYNTLPTKGR